MSNKQVALVTGANKGIGLEIARQLGRRGYLVLVGSRDRERGAAAVGALRAEIEAELVELDVNRPDHIAAAAARIDADHGHLDVLVNNAGISHPDRPSRPSTPLPPRGTLPPFTPPSQTPLEDVRAVFETNVFAIIAVIQAMLPLLRRAPAARIVNLSSSLGSLSRMTDPASATRISLSYPPSKTALNAVTVAFANELRDTPIKVNAVCPGYTATDLNNHSGPRTVQQAAIAPLRMATLPADGPTGTYVDEDGPVPW